MNAQHLRGLVDKLLRDESELVVQQLLSDLNTSLATFVSQPGQTEAQVDVASKLQGLSAAVGQLVARYEPSEIEEIKSIRAAPFFLPELTTDIRLAMSENPMTPAVVHNLVQKLLKQRASYLQNLTETAKSLAALNIEAEAVQPGQAEIGFRIPRALFENELEGLVKELGSVRRIIRAFSEVTTGAAERIEVHEISTTDPLFMFGMSPTTIAAIGAAVTWALATWKQVEDIRKIRRETSAIPSFSVDEIEGFFDKKINDTIEGAIAKKADELVAAVDGVASRKHEQETDMAWALKSILARVERGMTVEIRFLPPTTAVAEEGAAATQEQQAFATLREVVPKLAFPPPEPTPVLALPPPEPDRKSGASDRKKE